MSFDIVHRDTQNKSYRLKWTEYVTVTKSMHETHATLQLIINCLYLGNMAWQCMDHAAKKFPSVLNFLTSVISTTVQPNIPADTGLPLG